LLIVIPYHGFESNLIPCQLFWKYEFGSSKLIKNHAKPEYSACHKIWVIPLFIEIFFLDGTFALSVRGDDTFDQRPKPCYRPVI
jgi:hypothetical protein